MIYRIPSSKDNFITNILAAGRRATGSNAGASEVLEIFKLATAPQSASKAHILIAFDPTTALQNFSSSLISGSSSWHLTLKNVETSNPGIGSFSAVVLPVSTSWTEGGGHDIDYYTDKGVSNWLYARNGITWTNPGGWPNGTPVSAAVSFDTGHEDIDVDVSSVVAQAAYSHSNGFFIALDPALEQDPYDYYLKAFRGRQTHFPQFQPYLELRWNDATGSWNTSGVDLLDHTGSLVMNIYDLKPENDITETPVLHLHIHPRDWNQAVVLTATVETSGTVLTDAYYRVVDDISGEVIIPFGTGSTPWTKLSYNDSGNYFRFPMSNLVPGLVYRFDIGYYDIEGSWKILRGDEKFRVGG